MLVQFFETLKLISLHYSFVPPAFFEGIWQGKATAGALELLQSCLGLWWVWMVMNTVCFLHLSFLLIKTSYLLAVPEAYHGGPPQSWEKHWEAGILLREVRFMTAHRDRVHVKSNQPFSSSFEDFSDFLWLLCQAWSPSSPFSPFMNTMKSLVIYFLQIRSRVHGSCLPNSSSNTHSQRLCWHVTCHIWWNVWLTLDSQRPEVVSSLSQLYQLKTELGKIIAFSKSLLSGLSYHWHNDSVN